jgi:2'-5' RNA ligase
MEVDLRRLQRQAAAGADRHGELSLRTAVAIVLDDARAQLEPVRAELDPDAVAAGIPLHVTLLFPFVPREAVDGNVVRALEEFFAARGPFTLTLVGIEEFPGVAYAVPKPGAELRESIASLCERFPDCPPYGGEFAEVVPHATLGTWEDSRRQDDQVARARELTRGMFPLSCRIQDVALLEEHGRDRWRELRRFPLGVS